MKSFRYIFLLVIVCVCPALLFAQTFVNGFISTDTTWTSAGNPYIVTADVIVNPGVILTIKPGVVVRFDPGTRMGVRGYLQAQGQDTARIKFTSNSATPAQGDWKGIIVSGATRMHNVVGEYARKFLFLYDGGTNTSAIRGSVFTKNDTAVVFDGSYPDSLIVWRSLFEQNRVGLLADSNVVVRYGVFKENDWGIIGNRISVARSTFRDNGYGAILERSRLSRSRFEGNTEVALTESRCAVGYNRFNYNEVGVHTSLLPFSVLKFNHFRDNRIGLRVGPNVSSFAQGIFKQNSICDSWLANAVIFADSTNVIDLEENCWCDTDSASVAMTIFDGNDSSALGIADFLPMDTTFCIPDRVYPGDANYNGIANVFDIFPIGLKFGSTGPPRPNASLIWVGQPATDWGDTLFNGVDIKHTDCNGDGVINFQDVGAILLNYGNTHNSNKTVVTDGVPISILLPANVNEGDTVTFPIHFGSINMPAQNVYGLAFSLAFDSSLVKPGSISVSFDSSWMGTAGTDMIGFARDIFSDGTLDIGIVRTDQTTRSGSGLIADVTVVIDEDIAKTFIPLTFEFLESRAIDMAEADIPVTGYNTETQVSTTSIADEIAAAIQIYPNPASQLLQIEHSKIVIQEIQLSTIAGQLLVRKSPSSSVESQLEISNYPDGMYFLTVITEEGKLIEKIYIVR